MGFSSRTVDGAYPCKTASRSTRARGGSSRATFENRVTPRPENRARVTPRRARPSRVVSSPSIPFRPGAARSRLETRARDRAKVSTALGWIPRVVEWRARGARAPRIRSRGRWWFGKIKLATDNRIRRVWAISLKRVIAKCNCLHFAVADKNSAPSSDWTRACINRLHTVASSYCTCTVRVQRRCTRLFTFWFSAFTTRGVVSSASSSTFLLFLSSIHAAAACDLPTTNHVTPRHDVAFTSHRY